MSWPSWWARWAFAYAVSSPQIAVASAATFAISETMDLCAYTPLARRWFVWAVVASGVVAATVDSLVFLQLSGIGYGPDGVILRGLIVGKLWVVTLIGGPVAYGLRRVLPVRATA